MTFTVEYNTPCDDRKTLMKKINELAFAIIDLNQFLDTHPDCQDALDLFKKCAFTLKALRKEYVMKFGPLKSTDSRDVVPFDWVDPTTPWPWEKEV